MSGGNVINILVKNKDDILAPFYYKKQFLSDTLVEFICRQVNPNDKLNYVLSFICSKIDEEDINNYKTAIFNTFESRYNDLKRQVNKLLMISIIMFLIGILILGLALLFERLDKNLLLLEVYDIIAWVFVWDSVDIFVFKRSKINDLKSRFKVLKEAEVIFTS